MSWSSVLKRHSEFILNWGATAATGRPRRYHPGNLRGRLTDLSLWNHALQPWESEPILLGWDYLSAPVGVLAYYDLEEGPGGTLAFPYPTGRHVQVARCVCRPLPPPHPNPTPTIGSIANPKPPPHEVASANWALELRHRAEQRSKHSTPSWFESCGTAASPLFGLSGRGHRAQGRDGPLQRRLSLRQAAVGPRSPPGRRWLAPSRPGERLARPPSLLNTRETC